MDSAGILGTGSYLPKEEVGNEKVAARAGVTADWIERKTHIRTRRYAAPDEATSDLAAHASRAAMAQAGILPEYLDYLIVATSTGDHPQPPTSYIVQDLIGAHRAACIDTNVVCSGFVYGLELARGLLALRPGTLALVVAADLYSRILDFSDRQTAPLFGDGAGAAVLGPMTEPHGFLAAELVSRGNARQLIGVEAGGSRRPASAKTLADGSHYFRMEGRAVRDFVTENVPPVLTRLVSRAGLDAGEVNHLIPHQANGTMLTDLAQRAGLCNVTTHRTLERYGNVGSASVAVTLDWANTTGQVRAGDLVLLAGFGGGMAIGASLMRWGAGA